MISLTTWLVACGGGSPAAPVAPTGTVLFVSERTGGPVAMVVEGTGEPRPIARLPGATFPAAADPQGTHALVVSAVDGPPTAEGGADQAAADQAPADHVERLWLVALGDPSEPVPLGPPAQMVRNPSWSADGSFVVFESNAGSYRDLYRIARSGGPVMRLTSAPHGSFEPSVSGSLVGAARIAFGTSRDGNAEVYVMNLDGSDPTRLTVGDPDDVMPRFSPDGQRIAWVTHREGTARVWHMSPEGRDARALRPLGSTQPGGIVGSDLDHAWAPDSRHLAVVVQTGPNDTAIEVVDAVTGKVVGTIDGPGVDDGPSFTPDGQFVLHSAARGGTPDVYLASLDGKHVHRLTEDPRAAWLPRWVPR